MACSEDVLKSINSMGQRRDERTTLWQAIIDSFEKEGADGVTTELVRQMDAIQKKFDTALSKLDAML